MTTCKYIVGNSKRLEKLLKKASVPQVQLIISSPPYFNLLNYGDKKNQVGFGSKSYDKFLDEICTIFHACYELSTNSASFWLIADAVKIGGSLKVLPFDIANRLEQSHSTTWRLKDIIIWDKGRNFPWINNGNFKNQHEYILFFTKGDKFKFNIDRVREIADLKKWWKTYPERYNPDGKAPSNVWTFNTPIRGWGDSKQNHLCPFPFPLVEKIISIASDKGDWVLDPFTGSGTVLAISKEMGRNSVGIDLNENYENSFKNEVLSGAQRYWKRREVELVEIAALATNFKDTNMKLRKLKVASNICDHLRKINSSSLLVFAKDSEANSIEINVMQNESPIELSLNDEKLKSLIKQCKISPSLKVVDRESFIKRIKTGKAYKYRIGSFNTYTSACDPKTVLNLKTRFEFWYSDIPLKISNEK